MSLDLRLISCFIDYKRAELSIEPDISGKDEQILHEITGHQLIDTKTGPLLLVYLKNAKTGEEYTYSYPDIVDVELASFSDKHDKWYIYSLDRSDFKNDKKDKKMTYRIIFKK
ncbi:hypothetical protein [Bacillus atrophaeus]|uniref:hypothetical protein n=1 Tax=Bacillus atrophaeus TaxID=1452 RepID=UPI0022802EB5|nr:hypothetical protein [Bacillus atrophaeus]MCY8922383.1 hypothetical protein [Bacillus atrophaeus]